MAKHEILVRSTECLGGIKFHDNSKYCNPKEHTLPLTHNPHNWAMHIVYHGGKKRRMSPLPCLLTTGKVTVYITCTHGHWIKIPILQLLATVL